MTPSPLAHTLGLVGLATPTIRVDRMTTRAHFLEVAALRREAYGPRYPGFVQPSTPDAWDACPSASVLMAREAASERLLGTLRTRHSLGGREAGELDEQGFPDWLFAQGSFMTVERFAVRATEPVARRVVRLSLFAAVYAMGVEAGVEHVNGYTIEALAGRYRQIGMREPRRPLSLCDALTNGVPQRLLEVRTREIPSRSRVPFSRYLLWQLGRGLDRAQLLAPNLGGPAFTATATPKPQREELSSRPA